jgi:hypothetical protein
MARTTKTTTTKSKAPSTEKADENTASTASTAAPDDKAKAATEAALEGTKTDADKDKTDTSSADASKDANAGKPGSGDSEQAGPKDGVSESGAQISVICHRKDGRRRAGRRWDHGETLIAADEIDDFALQVLRADPHFTVKDA